MTGVPELKHKLSSLRKTDGPPVSMQEHRAVEKLVEIELSEGLSAYDIAARNGLDVRLVRRLAKKMGFANV